MKVLEILQSYSEEGGNENLQVGARYLQCDKDFTAFPQSHCHQPSPPSSSFAVSNMNSLITVCGYTIV